MSIKEQLNSKLKDAMRAKDQQTLNFVRMLKAKMTETTTKKGFSGEIDDALWIDVIGKYAKGQKKALVQYENLEGEAAAEHAVQIQWEIDACDEWLPTLADETTVRGWVQTAIDGLGGKGAHFGAVMGAVMKNHKDAVDPGMVRRLVEELNA
jgi:uncharacterized protein